jgi:hypothetical protein
VTTTLSGDADGCGALLWSALHAARLAAVTRVTISLARNPLGQSLQCGRIFNADGWEVGIVTPTAHQLHINCTSTAHQHHVNSISTAYGANILMSIYRL